MAKPLNPVDVFIGNRNVIEHADEVDSIITAVNKKLPGIINPNDDYTMVEVPLPQGTNKGAILEAAYALRKHGWNVTIILPEPDRNEHPILYVGIQD